MKKQPKKKMPEREFKKGVDHVGVTCVFYCHDGQGNLLMHKRSENCRDERGNWDVGGGSLEFGETFEEGVLREIKEEYCCDVLDLKLIGPYNILRVNHENKKTHWVAILFLAQVDPKQVKIGEPDFMDEIGWFAEGNWPTPLHSNFHLAYQMIKPHLKAL